MKRKSIKLVGLTAVLLTIGLLSGCTMPDPTNKTSIDEEATAIQSDIDLSGDWVVPSQDISISFGEDSTYETNNDRSGTYTFMDQNQNFAIADLFEHVDIFSCTDDKGKIYLDGALLDDLIIGFNEEEAVERYYVRKGRDSVDQREIIGAWSDINSDKYDITFNKDGTVTSAGGDGTYEMTEDPDCGTCVDVTIDDVTNTYAVVRYEKYLFLYKFGGYVMYQMAPAAE